MRLIRMNRFLFTEWPLVQHGLVPGHDGAVYNHSARSDQLFP